MEDASITIFPACCINHVLQSCIRPQRPGNEQWNEVSVRKAGRIGYFGSISCIPAVAKPDDLGLRRPFYWNIKSFETEHLWGIDVVFGDTEPARLAVNAII